MTQNHLIIMAKRPQMGRVKTRLAKSIGDVWAKHFFDQNLKQTMKRLGQNQKFKLHVATTPKHTIDDPYWPHYVNVFDQGRGDLGDRMQNSFKHVKNQFNASKILIIGSDIPNISSDHIERAFKALSDKKACFGPSGDGGYWIVGQNTLGGLANLFLDVRWSTEFALEDCLKNIEQDRTAIIDQLEDVDDIEDLKRLRALR